MEIFPLDNDKLHFKFEITYAAFENNRKTLQYQTHIQSGMFFP